MLAWTAGQSAHLEITAGLEGTYLPASRRPVAPITAITLSLLDDMSMPSGVSWFRPRVPSQDGCDSGADFALCG